MEKGAHPESGPSKGASAPQMMASEMDNLIER
jgi:hypothetical protein